MSIRISPKCWPQVKAFIDRNRESLEAEYGSYRDQHDYCGHDGNDGHQHFYNFHAFCKFQYGLWLEQKRYESEVS